MIKHPQHQAFFKREGQVISPIKAIKHSMRASKKTYLITLKSFKNQKRVVLLSQEGMSPNATSYLLKILLIQLLLYMICGMA
jgi:hypothetical protein